MKSTTVRVSTRTGATVASLATLAMSWTGAVGAVAAPTIITAPTSAPQASAVTAVSPVTPAPAPDVVQAGFAPIAAPEAAAREAAAARTSKLGALVSSATLALTSTTPEGRDVALNTKLLDSRAVSAPVRDAVLGFVGTSVAMGGVNDLAAAITDAATFPSVALTRPLEAPITSPMGPRFHPFVHRAMLHTGIDLGAACGTPIKAAASGRVTYAGVSSSWGGRVIIDNGVIQGEALSTGYAHMSVMYAQEGQFVAQGQIIGLVGTTGWSTGCHLHWDVWKDGVYINGAPYYIAASGPRVTVPAAWLGTTVGEATKVLPTTPVTSEDDVAPPKVTITRPKSVNTAPPAAVKPTTTAPGATTVPTKPGSTPSTTTGPTTGTPKPTTTTSSTGTPKPTTTVQSTTTATSTTTALPTTGSPAASTSVAPQPTTSMTTSTSTGAGASSATMGSAAVQPSTAAPASTSSAVADTVRAQALAAQPATEPAAPEQAETEQAATDVVATPAG